MCTDRCVRFESIKLLVISACIIGCLLDTVIKDGGRSVSIVYFFLLQQPSGWQVDKFHLFGVVFMKSMGFGS
jgi:hypothetical protein